MPRIREEVEEEVEQEEKEEDLYTPEGREAAEEDDEITNVEEGFMEGYDEDESAAKCANCKKILEEDFLEEEFHGELLRFCSDNCAREYEKEHKA
ncbi:MAG: hypothetical protein KKG75_04585 [Nanoarchaeota archaeon]|nr:hypothetical protein [Nanoarchaeota archaeon]